jgi:multimeric flavodoxin WrbA
VSARRAGTTSALDQMNKYFLHQQMPIISSRYWNMVHGTKAEDVRKDEEGLQIMRCLSRNMSWFLKLKEAGEKAGVSLPVQEEVRISTNFIR